MVGELRDEGDEGAGRHIYIYIYIYLLLSYSAHLKIDVHYSKGAKSFLDLAPLLHCDFL